MSGAGRCVVCRHGSRQAIEQALLNGKSSHEVAATFDVRGPRASKPDHKLVLRHKAECIPAAVAEARSSAALGTAAQVAHTLAELDAQVRWVIEQARKGRIVMDPVVGGPMLDPRTGHPVVEYDHRLVLAAVREGRANASLAAQIAGAVEEADQDAIEAARAAHQDPDVRAAIAEAERIMADRQAAAGLDRPAD